MREIPKITLTMLGATGSGKTLFLHGMYATLSAGIANYFVYTQDPDDDIDLMDNWDLLCNDGQLPPATAEVPTPYEFVFKYGIEPLLEIDCLDFRGGAGDAKAKDAGDAADLRARLVESDSVYVALDGVRVGEWVKALVAGESGAVNRSRDPMRVARLFTLLQHAVDERRKVGRPAPSLVVLITKSDVLPEVTGLSKGKALRIVLENLKKLAPVAYATGVTTLVCPVQIGAFGLGGGEAQHVDPTSIDPVGLHKPLIFSLWHYLTEGIADHTAELDRLRQQASTASSELETLRGKFAGGLFHTGRIRNVEESLEDTNNRLSDARQGLSSTESRATQLVESLGKLPIIRDGKLQQ